ncbi:adenylylsulfate reductase [Clostridiales bacterium PH28_bin88]|nr:adenylylsulfate reductase [Clostridiales bacterium PH28_bin88]
MRSPEANRVHLVTELLIIGGGAAGCAAAVAAKEQCPDLDVTIVEKAHIERSGCLAAGVNALNAYLNPGETPESFLRYVKADAHGLVREDLVYTMARDLNQAARRLESWGLPVVKDEEGVYQARGPRSVSVHGERIKPLMAEAVRKAGVRVLNRVVATNYITDGNRVLGVYGFHARTGDFHVITAKKVICATGGAAGIYRPNNPGSARHKTWYPPFNAGAGYALGIRAGAEMTSFEMRFIALRVKDTMAPTGTVAQGVKAPQINSLGERYLRRYHPATTPVRLWATLEENIHGRGPCFLDTIRLTPEEGRRLKEAYLDMCPSMVLSWADRQREPGDEPLEITGSEPYLVGGHAQAGYWVDIHRRTTLDDLYAAGDVAGGAPKKYVTGSMVEGEIAARHAVAAIAGQEARLPDRERVEAEFRRVFAPLGREQGISPEELKEAMQKVMDEYAGGACSRYAVSSHGLMLAREKLRDLRGLEDNLVAGDYHQLMQCHEVVDRLEVARVVVEHLLHRRETRWPCYQTRLDHPERDDSRWLVFVNSRYERERGQVVMLERPVTEGCLYGSADLPAAL